MSPLGMPTAMMRPSGLTATAVRVAGRQHPIDRLTRSPCRPRRRNLAASTPRAPCVARNSRRPSELHALAATGSGTLVSVSPSDATAAGTEGRVIWWTTRRWSTSITAVENIVVMATSRPSGLSETVCLGEPTGGRTLARTLPTASRVRGSTKTAKIGPCLSEPSPLLDRDHPVAGPAGQHGVADDDQDGGVDPGDPRRADLRAEPLPVGEVPRGHGSVVAGGVRAGAGAVHCQGEDGAASGGEDLATHPSAADQVADHEPLVGRRGDEYRAGRVGGRGGHPAGVVGDPLSRPGSSPGDTSRWSRRAPRPASRGRRGRGRRCRTRPGGRASWSCHGTGRGSSVPRGGRRLISSTVSASAENPWRQLLVSSPADDALAEHRRPGPSRAGVDVQGAAHGRRTAVPGDHHHAEPPAVRGEPGGQRPAAEVGDPPDPPDPAVRAEQASARTPRCRRPAG